jgi:hypothetical protein
MEGIRRTPAWKLLLDWNWRASSGRQFQNAEPPEAIRLHYPSLSLEKKALSPSSGYLGNKEVERDITEREREEEEYNRIHPTPREIKEKFARMWKQMLARKG